MTHKKHSKKNGNFSTQRNSLGLPGGFYAIDETFSSIEEMNHAINSFLRYLRQINIIQQAPNEIPELFGFITRTLKIQRTSLVQELAISSDFARGIAVIQVPELPSETPQEWAMRRDQILTTYWPTLQDAQIRATLQLYRALSREAREQLQKVFPYNRPDNPTAGSAEWTIHSGPAPCPSSKSGRSGKNCKS